MAQTHDGAIEIAASKIGITPDEYRGLVSGGLKWCMNCKKWESIDLFGKDSTRYDCLVPSCRQSKNALARSRHTWRVRAQGRTFVAARDGDKEQARRRVNYLVEIGLLPHPKSIKCTDCNQDWGFNGPRHEYDHYLGYGRKYHESVEVVCAQCHGAREKRRRDSI